VSGSAPAREGGERSLLASDQPTRGTGAPAARWTGKCRHRLRRGLAELPQRL